MPTYDYACDSCGHTFEEMQSFSEAPLKKCPQCKKNKLRRLIGTGAAILFKGSGFYQTDYRSESYKSAAKADESTPAAPASNMNGAAAKTTDTTGTNSTGTNANGKAAAKKPKS
jgi:putative FmdB family regulatory protein